MAHIPHFHRCFPDDFDSNLNSLLDLVLVLATSVCVYRAFYQLFSGQYSDLVPSTYVGRVLTMELDASLLLSSSSTAQCHA